MEDREGRKREEVHQIRAKLKTTALIHHSRSGGVSWIGRELSGEWKFTHWRSRRRGRKRGCGSVDRRCKHSHCPDSGQWLC
jgi:hypothetical protein